MAVIGSSEFSPIKNIYRGTITVSGSSSYLQYWSIGANVNMSKSFLTVRGSQSGMVVYGGSFYDWRGVISLTGSNQISTTTNYLTGSLYTVSIFKWQVVEYI